MAADTKPSVPVEVTYDAQEDAKTQARTSINYFAPQPEPVAAQQVIVKLQGVQASAEVRPGGKAPSLRDSLSLMKKLIREEPPGDRQVSPPEPPPSSTCSLSKSSSYPGYGSTRQIRKGGPWPPPAPPPTPPPPPPPRLPTVDGIVCKAVVIITRAHVFILWGPRAESKWFCHTT